eukprot:gene13685-biopygen10419
MRERVGYGCREPARRRRWRLRSAVRGATAAWSATVKAKPAGLSDAFAAGEADETRGARRAPRSLGWGTGSLPCAASVAGARDGCSAAGAPRFAGVADDAGEASGRARWVLRQRSLRPSGCSLGAEPGRRRPAKVRLTRVRRAKRSGLDQAAKRVRRMQRVEPAGLGECSGQAGVAGEVGEALGARLARLVRGRYSWFFRFPPPRPALQAEEHVRRDAARPARLLALLRPHRSCFDELPAGSG